MTRTRDGRLPRVEAVLKYIGGTDCILEPRVSCGIAQNCVGRHSDNRARRNNTHRRVDVGVTTMSTSRTVI
jgi:hypothetical protein